MTTPRHERIQELRGQGLSLAKIARRLRLPRSRVSELLHEAGSDPALRLRPCAFCGSTFQPLYVTHKFCSLRCQYLAKHAEQAKERNCLVCGRPFMPCQQHLRYCSDTCQREGKRRRERVIHARAYQKLHPPVTRQCEVCGTSFTATLRTKRWCSKSCKAEALHLSVVHHCKRCGQPYIAVTKYQRFCSPTCQEQTSPKFYVALTAAERAVLKKLGQGKATVGLQLLVQFYQSDHKRARVRQSKRIKLPA